MIELIARSLAAISVATIGFCVLADIALAETDKADHSESNVLRQVILRPLARGADLSAAPNKESRQ